MAYLINLHKTIDTSALLCYTRYIERKQTEKQRKKMLKPMMIQIQQKTQNNVKRQWGCSKVPVAAFFI